MATDNANTSGFGEVSRVRGIAFEYLSLGASVIGLVALGVLLVYVTIDAFDLANASPEWLLTYFLALVVPFLAFCLYSVNDPAVTRRSVGALGGGLVGVAAIFTAIEAFVVAIPRLSWQLAYLFVVAMPVTAYLAYVGSRGQVGAVGFGLVGRLVGGVAIGLALGTLFLVLDPLVWFLAYTLGVVPAAARCTRTAAGARCRERRLRRSLSGLVGVVAAVFLRGVIATYPSNLIIYIWTLAVPIAVAGGRIVADRGSQVAAIATGGVPLAIAIAGGFLAGGLGVPGPTVLLVLITVGVPTAVYVHRVIDVGDGLVGLALPALLVGGALVGALVVEAWGFPRPTRGSTPGTSRRRRRVLRSRPDSTRRSSARMIIIALVAVLSFVLGVGTSVFLEEYMPGAVSSDR